MDESNRWKHGFTFLAIILWALLIALLIVNRFRPLEWEYPVNDLRDKWQSVLLVGAVISTTSSYLFRKLLKVTANEIYSLKRENEKKLEKASHENESSK